MDDDACTVLNLSPQAQAALDKLKGHTTCSLESASVALGIGRTVGYQLAAKGQLADGVPVLRVGGTYRVPVAPLLRALGLDDGAA